MWLVKNVAKKQPTLLSILHNQKLLFDFFLVCIYKMDLFALGTAQAWRKNCVEAIQYGVKYG